MIAQAGCDVTESLPATELNPYNMHFFPFSRTAVVEKKSTRLAGNPFVCTKLTPRPESERDIKADNIEHWDFVLRQLFAIRGKPLTKSIRSV